MIRVHKVRGQSMSPAFQDNDFVVSLKSPLRGYRVGDVVVVRHSRLGVIIKRVAAIAADRQIMLQGDNPASSSSEAMGWIKPQQVLGRVCWHIAGH